jgi:hypothetical protein
VFLEVASSLLIGAGLGYMKLKQGKNEGAKIEKIAKNCGLVVKEKGAEKTIQLLRRTPFNGGVEYAYRIPLGLSFADFQRKFDNFQDGLNNKKTLVNLNWEDIKEIDVKGNIPEQIKVMSEKQIRKEIEMEYDGVLKIKVYNSPLPESIPYNNDCKGWNIPIGATREKMIYHNFDKLPHMIVAGLTRYGKTVFLKSTITTLIANQSHVKFTLLDLKGGLAFNRFRNLAQVQTVAKNTGETLNALKSIHDSMEKRMEYFLSKGYEDITEANFKERHFIIVDEAAQLSSHKEKDPDIKKAKVQCEFYLSEIARIGGGIGYRLIFCTQYPTGDTLPNQIKQNAPAKVCFPLDTEIASRVVLDESGAESLPLIPGRAIYRTDRKIIVQTPFITNEQIEDIIKPHIIRKVDSDVIRERATPRTDTFIIEEA